VLCRPLVCFSLKLEQWGGMCILLYALYFLHSGIIHKVHCHWLHLGVEVEGMCSSVTLVLMYMTTVSQVRRPQLALLQTSQVYGFFSMGTGGPLPRGNKVRLGRNADHSPHLLPRSWMSRNYTSSPPLRLHRCVVGLLYLFMVSFQLSIVLFSLGSSLWISFPTNVLHTGIQFTSTL
jgi:hypothetical protein